MRKRDRHRIVDWAKPDAAGEPQRRPSFRLAERWAGLAGRWTFASGLARAAVAILVASAVFVVLFRSLDGFDGATESVSPPTMVKTTPLAPEPKAAPTTRVPKALAWWLRPLDFEQSFVATDIGTPVELCGSLADLGYAGAKWAASQLFEGEWECFSDLKSADPRSRSFLVLRGGRNDVSRLMLRLTADDASARSPLIEKAEAAVARFTRATGVILSPDALTLLREWRAGGTWTSQGTFRIVAEAGKDTTRILTIAAPPLLTRPSGDDCREACRAWAASFGTQIVKARRVKTSLRAIQ